MKTGLVKRPVTILNFNVMSLQLFFSSALQEQATVELDKDTAHHLVQVVRVSVGDQIALTNGKGVSTTATILEVSKKKCVVQTEKYTIHPAPKRRVTIAVGLLKNKSRLEWFFEKATELGVTHFQPLITNRSERQHFRADRMEAIVLSAMLQSRQYFLPVVSNPVSFESFIQQEHSEMRLIAHCENDERKIPLHTLKFADSVSILIGPEGDFTKDEIASATAKGYQTVAIGDTRLRTETAALAASVLLTR